MTGYRLDDYGGLAEVVEINVSARTGEPIIPAGIMVTPVVPEAMTLAEGQKLVLENGAWVAKEDHIGEKYYMPEDKYGTEAHIMDHYGPLPDGASLTPPPEPTELERWLDSIKDKTAEELRSHLYSTQRYMFVDDDISKGPGTEPLCSIDDKAMTVDESSQEWLHYVGDDEMKAAKALAQKVAGKNYIRTAVAAYLGQEEA